MTRNKPAPDFDIFQREQWQPTDELVPDPPPPPPSEGSESTDEGGESG